MTLQTPEELTENPSPLFVSNGIRFVEENYHKKVCEQYEARIKELEEEKAFSKHEEIAWPVWIKRYEEKVSIIKSLEALLEEAREALGDLLHDGVDIDVDGRLVTFKADIDKIEKVYQKLNSVKGEK